MTDIGPGCCALDRHGHVNCLAYNFRSWEKKADEIMMTVYLGSYRMGRALN
jgi:hypothetical protein